MSATSANDVWAVGYHRDNHTGNSWPLTEHFNGTAWSLVSSPQPKFSTLLSVAEVSPADVWAVGGVIKQTIGISRTLTMHWDGSTWSVIPSPNGALDGGFLTSVVFSATNDVWAFGYSINRAQRFLTLAMHWDGRSWSVVPTINPPGNDLLWGGGAGSPDDAWAVGTDEGDGSGLIEMWNGTSWGRIPTPNVASVFRSYVPIMPNDAWALGYSSNGMKAIPLAEFWNGSTFTVFPTPTVSGQDTLVNGATAVRADNVWAVGDSQGPPDRTFTMNWNGSSWMAVASPNRGIFGDDLYGVTRIPGTAGVWAVGTYLTDFAVGPHRNKTLAMRLHC
ncbi:MAG TPA: hypothetical protein VID24_03665 [Candidatus Eremiobacteraceae bacterium]